MRYFLAVFAAAVLALSTAAFAGDKLDFDATPSFILTNRWMSAHGCAVNGVTLTSAHVLDPREPGSEEVVPDIGFRYEFRGKHAGLAFTAGVSNTADLGRVQLHGSIPQYAILGPSPKIGDRIRWVEYDWRKRDKWFQPRGVEAKVTSIYAGIVILDREAAQGASGGCAYNDAGEAIGLMAYVFAAEDGKNGTAVVGFWGGWWNAVGGGE